MKGLILLADGFEDTEAISTINILKRSGLEIISATPNKDLFVTSSKKIVMKADILFDDVKASDYDFLVIPGGGAVEKVWYHHHQVEKLIQDFIDQRKILAAICAAPSLIARMGGFANESFTCFPGFEKESTAGKHKGNCNVVVSNNFITAKAMYYTIDFALAIVEKLLGKETKKKLLKSIKGRG